jgi:hypothetical protein
MARTARLVCLISTVSGRCKKGRSLGRYIGSSGHTTKLKQSILFRYLWSYTYGGGNHLFYLMSVVPEGSVFTKQLTNYYLGRGTLHQE